MQSIFRQGSKISRKIDNANMQYQTMHHTMHHMHHHTISTPNPQRSFVRMWLSQSRFRQNVPVTLFAFFNAFLRNVVRLSTFNAFRTPLPRFNGRVVHGVGISSNVGMGKVATGIAIQLSLHVLQAPNLASYYWSIRKSKFAPR